MAVASGGGHWVQLLRLRPAFSHQETTFVTVREQYRSDLDPGDRMIVVRDATRWDKFGVVILSLQIVWALIRIRPHIVISTGAAPGLIALRIGGLFGVRTVWVDSIANCEEVSLSGRRIGRHADLWLTQWAHLASEDGPRYVGSVA